MKNITTKDAAEQVGWPERTVRYVCKQPPELGTLITKRMRVLSAADLRSLKRRLADMKPIMGRRKIRPHGEGTP